MAKELAQCWPLPVVMDSGFRRNDNEGIPTAGKLL
jgi:hypothetical protein